MTLSSNLTLLLSQSSLPGRRYIHNYQMLTPLRIIRNLSSSRQNTSCQSSRKSQEKSSPAGTAVEEERNSSGGLLTCYKGRQSSNDSTSDGNDEGLLTCRRVGNIIEQGKQYEEKIEKAEQRKQLQGTWKNLCRRSIPTKDSITLARTPFWCKIINKLRGNNMDERLQRYLGNIPEPYIRKSLTERRIELGEDTSKSIAKWACKEKKKVGKSVALDIKKEKMIQQTGEVLSLEVERSLNKKPSDWTAVTADNKKLHQQTEEFTQDVKKLDKKLDELGLEAKELDKNIKELGLDAKKMKQDRAG